MQSLRWHRNHDLQVLGHWRDSTGCFAFGWGTIELCLLSMTADVRY
jgi:hypothetical protein